MLAQLMWPDVQDGGPGLVFLFWFVLGSPILLVRFLALSRSQLTLGQGAFPCTKQQGTGFRQKKGKKKWRKTKLLIRITPNRVLKTVENYLPVDDQIHCFLFGYKSVRPPICCCCWIFWTRTVSAFLIDRLRFLTVVISNVLLDESVGSLKAYLGKVITSPPLCSLSTCFYCSTSALC